MYRHFNIREWPTNRTGVLIAGSWCSRHVVCGMCPSVPFDLLLMLVRILHPSSSLISFCIYPLYCSVKFSFGPSFLIDFNFYPVYNTVSHNIFYRFYTNFVFCLAACDFWIDKSSNYVIYLYIVQLFSCKPQYYYVYVTLWVVFLAPNFFPPISVRYFGSVDKLSLSKCQAPGLICRQKTV